MSPLEVWLDDRIVGTCVIETRPGFYKPSLTFTYHLDWLADTQAFPISPDLPLGRGPLTPAPHRSTFLAFDDAAPDRWGRRLLDADLRQAARQRGDRFASPSEIELLLAVSDDTRQGALRFRRDGQFLAPRHARAGVGDLSRLAAAADRFTDTGEVDEDVQELIGVGSSPGGAQPKAWIQDPNGVMHLAKFPRTSDIGDVSAWEMTAIRLQARAGIQVQSSSTIPLGPDRSIFLTRRFDRDGAKRIPFMSFRTAFQIDEYDHPDYATLAARVASISSRPDADAAELFSRAAMVAMVNNIDDHMRNHGLLHRGGRGWQLAPSFDVNPSRGGSSDTPLTPEDDPADRDIRLLLEHRDAFRLTHEHAVERLRAVDAAVSHWREDAVASGVEPDALDFMARAFEGPNRAAVAALTTRRPTAPPAVGLAQQATNPNPAPAGRAAAGPGDVWVRPHTRRGRTVEGHFRRRRIR
ncbi:type II toxin-antitoxin system HipA family toxin [Tersicoccus sp. MR15.9]|uniref:type II toxin-antitoxin system HipA family toxin n=1 Tax=Tersicoccus mangrovi TaxID=3121635 RepID=UPI002FE5B798